MTASSASAALVAAAVLVLGWSHRPVRPGRDLAAVRQERPGIVLPVPRIVRPRAAARRLRRVLVDELPEVVDLLAVAVSAGLTVPLALRVVAERGDGRVARELGRALDESERGLSLADALDGVVIVLGDEVRSLLRVLGSSLRDGTALGPALDRLSAEVRLDRRRAAEIRAKRLPVRLLFPLVVCVLPAFGLLTVVPLLAGSLAGIDW